MASQNLASEISGTRMVEFFARFGRFGGNAAKLQKLLGDDELMRRWVEQLDEFPDFRLVHGVFNKPIDVYAAFTGRVSTKGINFQRFSWIDSPNPPNFDPNDPETVVVLDATLDTLQNTFEFAWAWTVDGQDDGWRYDGMISDSEKLMLLDGLEFKPWTLRWVRIKLDTNVGKKPIDFRDPKSSPGCALLFMSAEHPARIKSTDYEKRFGFWLPGLKCTDTDEKQWRSVPYVDFNRGNRQVRLHSNWHVDSGGNLAVPSFRE